jgi:1-acyl-sn-glycerol-3-phosphate acyltransferase
MATAQRKRKRLEARKADSVGAILLSRLPHSRPGVRLLIRSVALLYWPWIRVINPQALVGLPEPVIFAFNHNNTFESVGVPATVLFHRGGRPIHFMIDWMYLKIPVVGSIMQQIEPIPVYTKPARWRLNESFRLNHLHESPIDACCRFLSQGKSIGIFPEGTRNSSADTLLPGRPGIGRLVLSSGAPVVPVGIAFPAGKRLGRVPRIGRCEVRIGKPISFTTEREALVEQLGEIDERTRAGIMTRGFCRLVADRVMTELAGLCGKDYPHSIKDDPPGEAGQASDTAQANDTAQASQITGADGGAQWHENRLRA